MLQIDRIVKGMEDLTAEVKEQQVLIEQLAGRAKPVEPVTHKCKRRVLAFMLVFLFGIGAGLGGADTVSDVYNDVIQDVNITSIIK